MNKLSIKLRVTLWYTIFMIIIVALVLTFILSISDSLLQSSVQSRLTELVNSSFKEIEFDDGELEIDDDLEYFDDGVYLSIYDSNGRLLYGRTPNNFTVDIPFITGDMQTAGSGETRWYIYDRNISVEGYGDVWVRGIASLTAVESTTQTMIYLALIALPFIVIIAAIGGYLITKRAFRPVMQISSAAEKIGGGHDLTQRINLGAGKDEIYTLAITFDSMFDRLQRSFEAEKQFTSDASHELRTPTSVIISQCEYAIENVTTLDEAKESLSIVLGQSQKMSRLISQLLLLARTDKGNQKLDLEIVNISELADIIVEEQRIIAKEKNIEIQTQIEPDIILRADQTMIMRLLINLISNAITYGKNDGLISVSLAKEKESVVGTIGDNGIGIAKEHINKIWDRFFQVNSARTANKDGSIGLGLSMVKWIVEAHGGTILVKSVLEEGSTFIFTIPIDSHFQQ